MSAAALNTFHNIWLKHATNNKELTLDVNNHPLPRTAEAEVRVYKRAIILLYVYECRHSGILFIARMCLQAKTPAKLFFFLMASQKGCTED